MSKPITDFLLARIADRESTARDMQDQARLGRPFFDEENLAGGTGIRELIDPARVLAECAAKRRIVDDYRHLADRGIGAVTAHAEWACRTLATVYADHPDYNPAWRP